MRSVILAGSRGTPSQDLPLNLYLSQGYWLDIQRHEDYQKASEEYAHLQPNGLY